MMQYTMPTTRQIAGREAKLFGHVFEHRVCDVLSSRFKQDFIHDGSCNTKVDIRSEDDTMRFSVKKTPTDLQVGLITQQNFIEAMNITDNKIEQFISEFFGGDTVASFSRHRKKIDEIDQTLVDAFEQFLDSSKEDIFRVAITHGGLNHYDNVNYMLFPDVRHDISTMKKIDLSSLLDDIKKNSVWRFNPTTIDLLIDGVKVINIQMFGSGRKYSNGYHSLQFRIACGKINSRHVSWL